MSVTIIDKGSLKRLIDGKTVDIDFGPFSVTIASEKWVKRMAKQGNIRDSKNGKVTISESFDNKRDICDDCIHYIDKDSSACVWCGDGGVSNFESINKEFIDD